MANGMTKTRATTSALLGSSDPVGGVAETRRAAEELAGMAAGLQRLAGQPTC
jgi:hypothetical protein